MELCSYKLTYMKELLLFICVNHMYSIFQINKAGQGTELSKKLLKF